MPRYGRGYGHILKGFLGFCHTHLRSPRVMLSPPTFSSFLYPLFSFYPLDGSIHVIPITVNVTVKTSKKQPITTIAT